MTEREERERLRLMRAVLERRTAELQVETDRLKDCRDIAVIRGHEERLKRHEQAIRAFDESLSQFHDRYGPIGR
jgi:hypothetical protein